MTTRRPPKGIGRFLQHKCCAVRLQRGLRCSEALESGMVGLNRPIVSDPAAPFGGVKQSGLGREGGHDGLLEFLESKYIAVTW